MTPEIKSYEITHLEHSESCSLSHGWNRANRSVEYSLLCEMYIIRHTDNVSTVHQYQVLDFGSVLLKERSKCDLYVLHAYQWHLLVRKSCLCFTIVHIIQIFTVYMYIVDCSKVCMNICCP
jgi:hypothetical protein